MLCSRCNGLMHVERAADRRAKSSIVLWACHACGERTDDVIRFNRAFYKQETVAQRNDRIMRELLHEALGKVRYGVTR